MSMKRSGFKHLQRGRAATMTHAYKHHGTTSLFAALNVKTGFVIGSCEPRPTATAPNRWDCCPWAWGAQVAAERSGLRQ